MGEIEGGYVKSKSAGKNIKWLGNKKGGQRNWKGAVNKFS